MTEPAPAPPTAPAATTRNPTAMLLGLIGAVLILVAGFLLDWVSGGTVGFKGTDAPISLFWSTDVAVEVSFASSAGFIVIGIGVIALIGAVLVRAGLLVIGGVLGVLAYALVALNLMRIEVADIGFGDFGLGLWALLVGGVVAIVAGVMSRRAAA